jgi:hypothetical protein
VTAFSAKAVYLRGFGAERVGSQKRQKAKNNLEKNQ